LTGLTQTHDRALLMRLDRSRLYREDTRLEHPFEAATRELERQQREGAEQRRHRDQQDRDGRAVQDHALRIALA
jgi:hypothetical protein